MTYLDEYVMYHSFVFCSCVVFLEEFLCSFEFVTVTRELAAIMAESIGNNLAILTQDIQSLKRQSEGIGTSKDTIDFRKQLTEMVDNISKLVARIKVVMVL